MSSRGFTGSGPSDFFAGVSGFPGQSTAAAPPPPNINGSATTPTITNHNHPLYRTQQQQPAIFVDPSSYQRQTPNLKRTLAEFQSYQNQNLNHTHNYNHNNHPNQFLSNLLLRSVKPRTLNHGSPMDFSTSQRYGMPLLNHQLRPNPVNLTNFILSNTNRLVPYTNPNLAQVNNNNNNNCRGVIVSNELQEKQIMNQRLQELEKQLLEDSDGDEEGDAVSVVTNSEWSETETIRNLIDPPPAQAQTQTQKFVSPSPTSSTTSSNSSSCSVASPASSCSKQSLIEAATAISEGNLEAASEILTRLAQILNPTGNSDQRFTDCMVLALKSRLNPVKYPQPVAELFSREHAESNQLLLDHCLCFKLAVMAANHAILDAAFEDKAAENGVRLCVVDFDVGNGKQYASLLHALSARLNGMTATVRVIAVVEDGGDERLKVVGDLLRLQAERLRVGFKFKVVTAHNELTRESLGCDSEEMLAVNLAFKLYRMPDESVSMENPRDEHLRRVKALAPSVVTLVEQDINANTAPLAVRVAELCSYYGALFESAELTMLRDNSVRLKVEEGLRRRIGNSVACEGRDRVERCEVFGKWRARLGMAGFRLKPASQSVAESFTVRLGPGNRVTAKEENGGICFSWMGRTLTVASTWR